MAIDTSIWANLLRPAKSVADYDAEALQGRQNRLALQVAQTQMDDRTRAIADGNKLRSVVAGFGADTGANTQALYGGGFLKEGQAYTKSLADNNETTAKAKQSEAQAAKINQEAVGLKLDQVKNLMNTAQTPEQAEGLIRGMYKDPDLAKVFAVSGDTADAAVSRIDRANFNGWKNKFSLGADQLIKYTTVDANTVANNQTSVLNNTATNETSRANNAATNATTERGQNMTDSRALAGQRSTLLQTDDGPMVVNTRTGESKPVLGPDGEALKPKLKPLPAPVQKAIMENDAALKKVDRALSAVDAYPGGLGSMNYLGDGIRQRTDPKGVGTRALVADIGSLKIHDRSGAAVTASETPRLQPFIPAATDSPATVKTKLGLFKQEYQSIQDDINATYSREQGYRLPERKPDAPAPKPATPKPAAAQPAAGKNSKGWPMMVDGKGNRAYVGPNGQIEEVK